MERAVDTLERRVPGPRNPGARQSKVWRMVLGVDRGTWFWVSAAALLIYNLLRAGLTWFVAPMRDEEERSDVSPAYRPAKWEDRPLRFEEPGLDPSENAGEDAPEQGSSRAPSRIGRRLSLLRLRCRQYLWACFTRWTEAYGWLVWPHRVARVLLALAVVSFAWNAWQWLMLDVWLAPS